jgi:hypothetical protein
MAMHSVYLLSVMGRVLQPTLAKSLRRRQKGNANGDAIAALASRFVLNHEVARERRKGKSLRKSFKDVASKKAGVGKDRVREAWGGKRAK